MMDFRVAEEIEKRVGESVPFLKFKNVSAGLKSSGKVSIRGVSGSLMAFVAAHLSIDRESQIVLITPDDDRAEELRDDCAFILGEARVRLFGQGPTHEAKLLDMASPVARIETLKALSLNENIVVVASAEAAAGMIPTPEQFKRGMISIDGKTERPFGQLIQQLESLGFERKDFVEEYGDIAVRGGIIDVFPFVGDNPIRLEFWGDSVESIREFDALSQRSIRELQSVTLTGGLSNDSSSSLFDHIREDAVVILDEPAIIEKEVEDLRFEGAVHIFAWNDVQKVMANHPQVIHTSLGSAEAADVDFGSLPQPPVGGSIKLFQEQLSKFQSENYKMYLMCDTEEEAARLKELLEVQGWSDGVPVSFAITTGALHSGFVLPSAGIAVFTEHQVFGRRKRRESSKRARFKGFTQKELSQLRRGDSVVHVDFGIGKFSGLQKLKVRGVEQEVMKVLYADNDVLYVNLNYINRVQKYSSKEGYVPTLTKLGGPEWERLKSRARKKIKDIARDLIKLYARRKHEEGFAFSPDTAWQKEMEASFVYEDTADQAKTTQDIKRDMENASPMDRLVCGDVGFGKTEVAVRAAFKAVMDGKQAAVLVPTTILAQQHYNTFLDRLGRYSVRVESLSRFKTGKEQESILEDLLRGRVDVLIGTHRLLSKDVQFKDLGLLVVDEEHRFGVTSKEKLRHLRASVDTLTLTATPIPRTLQFSLMGARDLSLINTPPRNRLPIITEIAQFDISLIREAILKEVHRSGQVYFIHDRIQNIDEMQTLLEEQVPEARFHIAHGQMKGHQLEKTMLDFLEKKYDVLVCTKIIESGIDIPSVNTIIINRADRFGLAELYQLRGRVGRSNIRAFAYLLTPPISSLPRHALRRLQAIQEFTELGSGFNLAMRDLEIRGAGNLLGAQQSGFIDEMGFEMYQRIVEEAVSELKEKEFGIEIPTGITPKEETVVEADVEAYIPDFYVESDAERLDIYRRIYKSSAADEIQGLRAELEDRFGEYPPEVEHLFQLVELKILAGTLGFTKIELTNGKLSLSLPKLEDKAFYEGDDERKASFQRIMNRVSSMKQHRPQLRQDRKQLRLDAVLQSNEEPLRRIQSAREFLKVLERV